LIFAFWKKLFTALSHFRRTFASKMEKSERQKRARALASEYLELLMEHEADQERMVRQMVDERLAELKPEIEALVDERIKQRMIQNSK
jgi:hypothetical protein